MKHKQNKPHRLTTVKVLTGLYKQFKIAAIETDITLGELLNTTMNLYVNDPTYRFAFLQCSVSGSNTFSTNGHLIRR